jgi:ubiquinone/menaquinone biosynthesis C-methylase UbiE
MGLYDRYLLAPLTDRVCASGANAKHRARVIPRARGRVVELGAGSGLNLPFYDRGAVETLWAVEPSREMWRLAASRLADAPFARWVSSSAERIPLDDGVADTVVVTWALCTIPDPARALAEARRLLKPDGVLLFAEHGRAPDADVRAWQDRINPVWSRLSGGCNLNRDAPALIASAGFTVDELEAGYLPGARPFTFNVRGVARRSA